MKRRILLVDDEVAVLLTMKAVLEISGFEVDTAASAREGKHLLRNSEYHMIITDMRMENDEAGREVVQAAREATYHPAVALLTAFPVEEEDWQDLGADKLLLKPMHTHVLLEQIEHLFETHDRKLATLAAAAALADGAAALPSLKPALKSQKAAKKPAKKAVKEPAKKAPVKSAKKTATATKGALKKVASKTPPKKTLKKPASKAALKNPARKASGKR